VRPHQLDFAAGFHEAWHGHVNQVQRLEGEAAFEELPEDQRVQFCLRFLGEVGRDYFREQGSHHLLVDHNRDNGVPFPHVGLDH